MVADVRSVQPQKHQACDDAAPRETLAPSEELVRQLIRKEDTADVANRLLYRIWKTDLNVDSLRAVRTVMSQWNISVKSDVGQSLIMKYEELGMTTEFDALLGEVTWQSSMPKHEGVPEAVQIRRTAPSSAVMRGHTERAIQHFASLHDAAFPVETTE